MSWIVSVLCVIAFLGGLSFSAGAQHVLEPGFDKSEYTETLRMASAFAYDDYTRSTQIEGPQDFNHLYRSSVIGLENMWDLWLSADSVAAISIRGSVSVPLSWMANYYAGMIPAQGSINIKHPVDYKVADNTRAAVHAGWLTASLYLSEDILPRIDSLYGCGVRQIIIAGHSQGGAISYLLTALFYQKQKSGALPSDIRFKTYCSAAPKPGNLQFAYEYEEMTRGGWAFNVVSSIDWVPETPLSVQTINDFVPNNPFDEAKKMIKEKKGVERLKYTVLYQQITRPTKRSERRLNKYLGQTVGGMIEAQVSGFQQPQYAATACYMRAGEFVVLMPDDEYYLRFPAIDDDKFIHHMFNAYKLLIDRY